MIPLDKQAHFFAGGFVFAITAPHIGLALATVAVLVAAFGKEIYDYMHQDCHTPDIWDAVATIAGGLVVAAATIL